LKPIVIPAEHGSWSLIGTPALLGLIVEPSIPGALLTLSAFALLLARQPLKMAVRDLGQGKRYPRTSWAIGFAVAFLTLAKISVLIAHRVSSASFVWPLAVMLLLAGGQFLFDVRGKGRTLLSEVIGVLSASLFAPIVALSGGLEVSRAYLLGAIVAVHSVLAVVYVGVRVDLSHQRATSLAPVGVSAMAAMCFGWALVWSGWAAWPMAALFTTLAIRAVWGVSKFRARPKAHVVGVQEVGYSLLLLGLTLVAERIQAAG